MIDHKPNNNFKSHIIFAGTQEGFVAHIEFRCLWRNLRTLGFLTKNNNNNNKREKKKKKKKKKSN
jgi:hypothetical protein